MANVKLTYINSTGGYVQPTATTDVVQSVGKIELTGVSGVAIDAGGAAVTNLGSPTNSTDAATKAYVDALAFGLGWKQPVRAVGTSSVTLSGSQTVDSVSLTDGDRVLITGQNGTTPDSANGIYVVNTGGSWTRALDANALGELPAGSAVFVSEGTTYADSQWVLTTNGAITPGTTAIIFAQFGGGGSYSAGSGLNLVGSTFSVKGDATKAINVDGTNGVQVVVDTNYGLSIDSSAGLRVDLATDPGLEFSSGNLRVKVASADQLSLDASGVNVVGVPSQFKINGSAVSTNVTHTNLNALTDSASITALHLHANLTSQLLSAGGVAAGNPIYVNGSGAVANAAANSTTTAGVVGVSLVNAGTLGDPCKFQTHGACAAFSGLTVGAPYYLDDSGGVDLYTGITSGNRVIRIGYALTTSIIMLNIQDMGVKP